MRSGGVFGWLALALTVACSNGKDDDSSAEPSAGRAGAGALSGSGGSAPAGASGAGLGGASPGGTTSLGGASGASPRAGAGGASGGGAGGGGGGDSAGSSGTVADPIPLPTGSREAAAIVNLVDAAAAAELEQYLMPGDGNVSLFEGHLTAAFNLFVEHYAEQYDFLYLVTDHPVDSPVIGRFEDVTRPAMPGTGLDFDVERAGYKTNGRIRGVLGVQYRPNSYGPFVHEMTHYWANYLSTSFGFGIGLNEDVGAHWGYTGVNGVLGGFDPATLRCVSPAGGMPPACDPESNGRYRYVVELFFPNDNGVDRPYGPLELYLMGLIPLSEVPAQIPYLTEAESDYDAYDEANNTIEVEASGLSNIAVADIVAAHGTVAPLAPKDRAFTSAFAVISATPAADSVMTEVAEWAATHGNRTTVPDRGSFETLTGGRATLDTVLGPRRSMTDPPPPAHTRTGCDIDEQDCGTGKACYFNGAFGVCGLSGGGKRDEPCTAAFDCAPGFDCAPSQTMGAPACEPYCSPDNAAPDACASQCEWFSLADENNVILAGLCQAP